MSTARACACLCVRMCMYLRNIHCVMCTMASEFDASIIDVIGCVSTSSIPFCLEVCGSFFCAIGLL